MSYLGLLLAFRIPLYVQLLLNILISKMVSPQVVLRALGGLLHVSICDLLPQAPQSPCGFHTWRMALDA